MVVAGSLLVLSQVQAVFKFVMGNATFLRNQKGDANNVDVLHTLSEITMARSKIWMILGKTRTNAWRDNMMSNNSKWKETLDCLNLSLGSFLAAFCFSLSRQQQLVNHFIMNVPGVVVLCKRLGIRISF